MILKLSDIVHEEVAQKAKEKGYEYVLRGYFSEDMSFYEFGELRVFAFDEVVFGDKPCVWEHENKQNFDWIMEQNPWDELVNFQRPGSPIEDPQFFPQE